MRGEVGIVGAGQVGAAAGNLLANVPGVSEVVLVELDRARAALEAADIAHAAAFGRFCQDSRQRRAWPAWVRLVASGTSGPEIGDGLCSL
jgi:L-lactate dehydrogenase